MRNVDDQHSLQYTLTLKITSLLNWGFIAFDFPKAIVTHCFSYVIFQPLDRFRLAVRMVSMI